MEENMKKKFICAHFRKNFQPKALKKILNHNLRENDKNKSFYRSHPEYSKFNESWINPNYSKEKMYYEVKNEVEILYQSKKNKKIPRNYNPVKELFIAPTPDKNMSIEQYQKLLDKSLNNALDYFKSNNIEVLSYHKHFDETTPHCHVIIRNQDLSTGKTLHDFFNKEELSKLQDIVASDLPYGYQRGMKGSKQTHKPLADAHKIELKNIIKETEQSTIQLNALNRELIEKQKQLDTLNRDIAILNNKKNSINKDLSDLKVLIRDTATANLPKMLSNSIRAELNKYNKEIKQLIKNNDHTNAYKYFIKNILPLMEKISVNLNTPTIDPETKTEINNQIKKVKSNFDLSL